MSKPVGWRKESQRHALASKGIKTGKKGTTSKPMFSKSRSTPENLKSSYFGARIFSPWAGKEGGEVDGFQGFLNGWNIEIYPIEDKGWEYRLFREKDQKEYDSLSESSVGNDHAKTPEKAMAWAENTIMEWDD